MEDKVSQDSLSVTDEFVVVPPTENQVEMTSSGGAGSIRSEEGLKIAGNGNMEELQHHLEEVLDERGSSGTDEQASTATDRTFSGSESNYSSVRGDTSEGSADHAPTSPLRIQMHNLEQKVLTSHVHMVSPQSESPATDGSSDPWEPRSGDERRSNPALGPLSVTPLEKTCTLFSSIIYLGSATVNAPRSDQEVARNMSILRAQESASAITIILSVPRTSQGSVRLLDPDGRSEISHFRITKILFCCRGLDDGPESDCFAFTCSHGSRDAQIFQCHVFRCANPEAVQKVLSCFGQAFHRVPRSPQLVESSVPAMRERFFNLTIPVWVDIREEDGKGGYYPIPRDSRCFKMKQGAKKEIRVAVQPTDQKILNIEKCFGLLISPGREVPNRDMHLLNVIHQGYEGKSSFVVTSIWDPNEVDLSVLNTESPPGLDKGMFMTIAVDLIVTGIQEPVRFIIETRVKIVPPSEKFWPYFNKKPIQEFFYLCLEEEDSSVENEFTYKVLNLESQGQREWLRTPMRSGMSGVARTPDSLNSYQEEEESDDEPLQSGSGNVDKDCAEDILQIWGNVLEKWHADLSVRPKQLKQLVRKGIPEALRGEVWQLLSRVHESEELFEEYRILITKESKMEDIIKRDIARTFPAHEKFQREDEGGQEAILKISKAYSVFDSEVSYCQGMSFLTAVLWLHMPEEQAFAILAKIMYDYQLRDLFLDNFNDLHSKFYQLERLIEDLLPDLYSHFVYIGIEVHMFASQWFLTLFTHKFPLTTVFHIIDVFLSEGMSVVFNVAIALLKASKKDLLGQDFEGVLKYFRISLPKKYRSEEAALELIQLAMSTKINSKKMKKYEKEYEESVKEQEEPLIRLERENKEMMKRIMRLELEQDELASDFIDYKEVARKELNQEESKSYALRNKVDALKSQLEELETRNHLLESETISVKEMHRKYTEKAENDSERDTTIIDEYKMICSQQSERLEKQQQYHKEEMLLLKSKLDACETCRDLIMPEGKLVQSVHDSAAASSDAGRSQELEGALSAIRDLELELAQTKLQLVESQCRAQDLEHELASLLNEIQQNSRHRTDSWISKTFSSLKDATVVKKE